MGKPTPGEKEHEDWGIVQLYTDTQICTDKRFRLLKGFVTLKGVRVYYWLNILVCAWERYIYGSRKT